MSYTAYLLDEESRIELLEMFEPMFEKVIAHHITVKFGVPSDTPHPIPAITQVVGHRFIESGLQALVCTVNSRVMRPDQSLYHITWSLNPSNHKPSDSNAMLLHEGYEALDNMVRIRTRPVVLG